MQTKKEFVQFFQTEIEPNISATDKPALRQAWNDTVDELQKKGTLPKRAGNWSHPDHFYTDSELRSMGRRRTVDQYTLRADYGQGYEDATTENSYTEIKERLKEYREAAPEYRYTYKKTRVRI